MPDKGKTYQAFGLNIFSEIPLPELSDSQQGEHTNDITISKGNLAESWMELGGNNRYFIVKQQFTLFRVPETAIYCIKDNEIIVSPFKGAQDDKIRLYILGTCIGVLLLKRKVLPLHGSAIEVDGKAYAIIGDSGAGKSTLASALMNLGCKVLSDDVIPVILSDQKLPLVNPAYPQQKLWHESLHGLGMDSSQFRPIIKRETKFAVPITAGFAERPVPLAGIFELCTTDREDNVMSPIQDLERFSTLFYHTYRHFLLARLDIIDWHFNFCAAIVNKLDFNRIHRSKHRFTANELAENLLAIINKGVGIS